MPFNQIDKRAKPNPLSGFSRLMANFDRDVTEPKQSMNFSDNESIKPSKPTGPTPRRRQTSSLSTVLGLLVPVVLGGVTVFGVYVLFLDDFLGQPFQRTDAKPPSESPESQTPPKAKPPNPPPQPTFAPDPETPRDLFSEQIEPARPPNAADVPEQESPEDREAAAKNALGLAEKMLKLNPEKAPEWYRKVIDRYPGTDAARKAEAWLKKRAGEP